MEKIVIKFVVVYLLIGTFILMNFMFNKRIKFYFKNKETGEIKYPSGLLLVGIALYWIVTIPILLIIRKEDEE